MRSSIFRDEMPFADWSINVQFSNSLKSADGKDLQRLKSPRIFHNQNFKTKQLLTIGIGFLETIENYNFSIPEKVQ